MIVRVDDNYILTSIDARLWRASLLRRIVDGASAKALEVCARFFVGELFRFFWAFGDQGRDWNALTRHLALEISISEHASSASLVVNAADNSLACFQVLEQRYDRANCRIFESMLRGSQQPKAIIGKNGCRPRRKIPKVEGIRQNNSRTGIFHQSSWISKRFSVIVERLVPFAVVV